VVGVDGLFTALGLLSSFTPFQMGRLGYQGKVHDFLTGRSILHQCIATYGPKADMMCFDFDTDLKQSKQKILDTATFGNVDSFAEFSENR